MENSVLEFKIVTKKKNICINKPALEIATHQKKASQGLITTTGHFSLIIIIIFMPTRRGRISSLNGPCCAIKTFFFSSTFYKYDRNESFRENSWDPCKYVLDSRYLHPDIAVLQWVVVSQGWKTTTLSFHNPADRYSNEMQAYFCFQLKKRLTDAFI